MITAEKIQLRATINEWISARFPTHRKFIKHSDPTYRQDKGLWEIRLNANGCSSPIGWVLASLEAGIVQADSPAAITRRLEWLMADEADLHRYPDSISGENYRFVCGDGIAGASGFADGEIALLLTDPPYGISKSYICEKQVPRRLRNDGRDFIMPKGNFGDWDNANPQDWFNTVLPKVGGWVISFCAQAQIGEYQDILEDHKFVAVGAMVWQKTNPVPFNHKHKPINAWEAMIVGKRPGTKFHGAVTHNVFRYKSPSPQERIHPTQKPLDLMEHFIDLFTKPGETVFDPFGGGATTLIAAAGKGREAISFEMDDGIYQKACNRIKEMIG